MRHEQTCLQREHLPRTRTPADRPSRPTTDRADRAERGQCTVASLTPTERQRALIVNGTVSKVSRAGSGRERRTISATGVIAPNTQNSQKTGLSLGTRCQRLAVAGPRSAGLSCRRAGLTSCALACAIAPSRLVVWIVRDLRADRARLRATRDAVASRADEQHGWTMAGDDRGTFGQYPPATMLGENAAWA
jgi:hypothetical protein